MTDDAVNLAAVWVAATEELANETLSPQQQAWLRLTRPLALVEDTAFIAAPNPFTRDAIESRLRPAITEALSRRLGRSIQLAVAVQPSDDGDQLAGEPVPGVPAPVSAAPPVEYRMGESPDYRESVDYRMTDPAEPRDTAGRGESGPRYQPAEYPAQGYPTFSETSFPGTPFPRADGAEYAARQGTGVRPADGQLPLGEMPAPPLPGLDIPVAPQQPPRHRGPAEPLRRVEVNEPAPVDNGPSRVGNTRGDAGRPVSRPDTNDRVDTAPVRPAGPVREFGGARTDSRLNPKYTFETFVIGSSNRFAHAAAIAVAESPAKAYNPLFVYGGSGLGKTHLLHAIGHYAASLGNARSVRYVSTEEFTNDFINSLRDDKTQAFQRRYRDADILLIDDIQFLESRERTQEEFFHTFNTLHNANKQIVITSDRSPKQLSTLEDRLRTRFEWGLLADIQPPDLETRIAILQKKAAHERLYAPLDVLEFIASRIQNSIRELEGALIRVTAFASLNRAAVDLGLAEEVLRDLIPDGAGPEINSEQIMTLTADYFGVSMDDLRGHSRSRVLVNARQVAMYLCRELTDLSLPRIGQAFGGRDHTTVMHADRKIRRQMAERRSLYNQIAELTNRIKQQEP
ncbi:chromosomal replication initiator protein DnaA [Actinocatenispora rupis]|uniref:Chromosomal replication initiator protein DnaA n=1 Tax=Actinocatenispora rupis TaxID=519421 RepID=A0A8J3J740_9ACTN|nr:chromosomal replication initiator protein DnaA [Actinocatenispora rupis]GID13240.1 chromosomal replication initiator protein DnaA [Actinocatenispora rupis]